MTKSVERIENLIRVLRGVDPAKFHMGSWCQCAIGHARHDFYFIDIGLAPPMSNIAEFFDISTDKAYELFLSSGYLFQCSGGLPTPSDVIAKLEVVLAEKRSKAMQAAISASRFQQHSGESDLQIDAVYTKAEGNRGATVARELEDA